MPTLQFQYNLLDKKIASTAELTERDNTAMKAQALKAFQRSLDAEFPDTTN